MVLLIRFTLLLAVYLSFVPPSFGGDLNTLLPAESPQSRQKTARHEEKTVRVGEVVTFPLFSSKSYSSHAEVDGDAVRIAHIDMLESVTLQAARPGSSMVRIYRKFWRDPDIRESYELIEEIAITVKAKASRNLIKTPNNGREDKDIPLPQQQADMDWEGFISRQSEELLTVITDNKEWTALWNSAFNKPAPKIDFEKYAVACVFLGFNADWLYHIHIGEPRTEGNILMVPYSLAEIILELSGPFRASGQYRMKAVQKKKGYGMILEKMREGR